MSSANSYKFRALLCDMDGTFADTESLSDSARTRACRDWYDIDLTEEERASCYGISDQDAFERIFRLYNIRGDVSIALSRMQAIYHELLRHEAKPYPETKDFLERVSALDVPRAVVSGSTREQVHIILKVLSAEEIFHQIISSDDVHRSKPYPEPYLKAAELVGFPASSCLSIEDSECGVQSAKSAKTFCIAVRNNGKGDLTVADEVVENLAQINFQRFFNKTQS